MGYRLHFLSFHNNSVLRRDLHYLTAQCMYEDGNPIAQCDPMHDCDIIKD